jgi:hypothetical protein
MTGPQAATKSWLWLLTTSQRKTPRALADDGTLVGTRQARDR